MHTHSPIKVQDNKIKNAKTWNPFSSLKTLSLSENIKKKVGGGRGIGKYNVGPKEGDFKWLKGEKSKRV